MQWAALSMAGNEHARGESGYGCLEGVNDNGRFVIVGAIAEGECRGRWGCCDGKAGNSGDGMAVGEECRVLAGA